MNFHTIITDFRNKLLSQGNITTTDIEAFYSKINNLNLSFSLFPKYYRKYIANLNRLKPDAGDENPDLTLLKVALTENEWKPTRPFNIFVHRIMYDYKLTSKFFISRQKKNNLKKLNSPEAKTMENEKPKFSKEWTRVPIGRIPPTKKR